MTDYEKEFERKITDSQKERKNMDSASTIGEKISREAQEARQRINDGEVVVYTL